MAVIWSPESEHAKEMAKWEMHPTPEVPKPLKWGAGGRMGMPFQEYPKFMGLAGRTKQGVPTIIDEQIAASEVEEANLRSRGFGAGHGEAMELLHARDQAVAVADAERNYTDRKMSPEAQREAKEAEDSTARHLGEIPALPVQKGKR